MFMFIFNPQLKYAEQSMHGEENLEPWLLEYGGGVLSISAIIIT